MKKYIIPLLAIMLVCLTATAVFLIILPDLVPVAFTLDGTITDLGSKWMHAILPAVTLALGLFALCFMPLKRKHSKILKAILITAIVLTALLTALSFVTLLQISILELSGK